MYLFSLCSFRPLDRNAGQTMSKIQTIKTGCKMKGMHALYEPGFLAFFPQLQVLQRKKKLSEILLLLAFDKQEADQPGAKCITHSLLALPL